MRRRTAPLALTGLAFVVAFAQSPGKTVADTKLSLYVDPGRFLTDVLSAWSPTTDLGHVWAGQYGGYAFPMAPWFALGHGLGLPMWVVQRLWLAALLAVAAWGMVRLLDALLPSPRGIAHLTAGALFIVNPYVAVYTDRTSVALLAYAALPWLLLCVHRGLRDPRGWWWPAAFALVLTATGGGVNVAVTGWVLVAPALLALYEVGWGGVGGRALWPALWRVGVCALVVNAWWLAPLLAAQKYGLNFLPFTEQPGTIWQTTSVSESLRLVGFWTSYVGVGFGGHLYPFAGHGDVLLFSRPVVLCGLLVPALTLASLRLSWRTRYVPFLLAMTIIGVVIMAAGFPEGTPFRRGLTFTYNHVQALQFLRTTYKAGPLVAAGIAALAGVGLAAAVERLRARGRGWAGWAAIAGAAAIAFVAAWPLTTGRAEERQLRFHVPVAWHQVAADLSRRSDNTRALIEPGQLFAFSRYGGTIDELLPALTSHLVTSRYIVPFADLRSVDLQWSVDDLINQQRALPGQLPPLLDLMGVGDLVLAADRDRARGGGPPLATALDALRAGGVSVDGARAYGPSFAVPAAAGTLADAQTLPEVQRKTLHTGGIVRVLPRRPETIVDGDAGGILSLAAFGALHPDLPLRFAADLTPPQLRTAARAGATIAISDSNRRQPFVAARLVQNRGAVLPADQSPAQDGVVLDPFPARGSGAQTVAVVRGIRSVSAPFSPQVTQFPEHAPIAALDGNPNTEWIADLAIAPPRHHLDIVFDAPRDVGTVALTPYSDSRGVVTHVSINGKGFAVHRGVNHLRLGLRHVAGLSVLIDGIRHPRSGTFGAGGIRELKIPGVHVSYALRVPQLAQDELRGVNLSRTPMSYLLNRVTADDPLREGPLAGEHGAARARDAQDAESAMARIVDPPAARWWVARAWLSVAPGADDRALDRLAGAIGPGSAWSSSRFEGIAGYRASGAFDGLAGRAWIGQWIPGRPAWLAWTTHSPTTVRELRLSEPRLRVRRPTAVRVVAAPSAAALARIPALDASGRPSHAAGVVAVGPGGVVRLPSALRGRAFRLEVVNAAFPAGTAGPATQRRAVAIAELGGAGLELHVPRSGPLHAPCGTAAVIAGGRRVGLRVAASIAALDGGRALRATGCGRLAIPAAPTLVTTTARPLAVDALDLSSPSGEPAPAVGGGTVVRAGSSHPGSWDGVKVRVSGPSWLVLGESFNRGWRASCDGHDLGSPVPIQGYANGWTIGASCHSVRFWFGPNRVLDAGYIVSLVGAIALLALLFVRRRRAAVPAADLSELPDVPRTGRLGLAAALGLALFGAGVVGFVFALRAGAVAFPLFAFVLWRGVPTRWLLSAAGAILVVAMPVLYLLGGWRDHGGFNSNYANDHQGGHWAAVAGLVLLGLALVWTLWSTRRRGKDHRRLG